MVSSKEKREFIENIIKMSHQQVPVLELQLQLHEFLLRDTDGGKLYKYRSFDKNGFSLNSLEKGTLHCSRADVFNDPFDCKIGVTFQSLYTAKYETEIELINKILEKYIQAIYGEVWIEESSVEEQRVIKKLLSNKVLNDFIARDNTGEIEEDVARFLKSNAFIIVELMQTILSDDVFKHSLGVCADMLPHMIENISPEGMLMFSDENVSLEDYVRANGIIKDTDEIELIMLLNQKLYPENNEAVKSIQKLMDDMEYKLADKIKNLFLIGCLCTNYKNRLMWSHYADSHKGFCIEYDFSEKEEDVLLKLPLPVFYSENRPLIPWKAALENTSENMEDAYTQLMIGLLTKDRAWEYENEWRILITATEDSEIVMPKISCIYLGALIEKDNRERILVIAKKHNIPVKQMKVDRGAYDLHAEEVNF